MNFVDGILLWCIQGFWDCYMLPAFVLGVYFYVLHVSKSLHRVCFVLFSFHLISWAVVIPVGSELGFQERNSSLRHCTHWKSVWLKDGSLCDWRQGTNCAIKRRRRLCSKNRLISVIWCVSVYCAVGSQFDDVCHSVFVMNILITRLLHSFMFTFHLKFMRFFILNERERDCRLSKYSTSVRFLPWLL